MARTGKPNILVIWGDDIGIWNLSCYHRGTMGSRTPNIDRIAAEAHRQAVELEQGGRRGHGFSLRASRCGTSASERPCALTTCGCRRRRAARRR